MGYRGLWVSPYPSPRVLGLWISPYPPPRVLGCGYPPSTPPRVLGLWVISPCPALPAYLGKLLQVMPRFLRAAQQHSRGGQGAGLLGSRHELGAARHGLQLTSQGPVVKPAPHQVLGGPTPGRWARGSLEASELVRCRRGSNTPHCGTVNSSSLVCPTGRRPLGTAACACHNEALCG